MLCNPPEQSRPFAHPPPSQTPGLWTWFTGASKLVAGVEGADDSVMVDVSWAMWWVPWLASAKYQETKRSYFRSVGGEIQLHHQNVSHNRHDTDDAEALNLPPSNQRSQKRRYKKCAKSSKAVLNWQSQKEDTKTSSHQKQRSQETGDNASTQNRRPAKDKRCTNARRSSRVPEPKRIQSPSVRCRVG